MLLRGLSLPASAAFGCRRGTCRARRLATMTQGSTRNGSGDVKIMQQKPLNATFSSLPTTIFTVMTNLSVQYSSVNLGQGFPDAEGPDSMKRVAGAALLDHHNQYAPLPGLPELRQAVAQHAEATHPGISVDPATEAIITLGATEALSSAMLALLNPGDEVVLLDPMYDAYGPMCKRAGGVPRIVQLDQETWGVRREALAAAFSPATKLLLLNSPHNPTGKVFSREDLEFIARLCVENNTYVISDEVYEHLVFQGHEHTSIRALPGMADRTIRIGSAGKTFSLTAWKVGWATGPKELIGAITKAHQFVTFCIPSNFQRAVAYGLTEEQSFYKGLGASLQGNREYLQRRLEEIGFRVLAGQGTYFLVADLRPLARTSSSSAQNAISAQNGGSQQIGDGDSSDGSVETDVDFCQRLTVEAGVTLIPVSAFYSSPDPPRHLVRFCFCKSMEKLERACDQMQEYFNERQ